MAGLVKQRDEYGSFLTSETGKTNPKALYRKAECSVHMSLLLAVALSQTIVCVIIIRHLPPPLISISYCNTHEYYMQRSRVSS